MGVIFDELSFVKRLADAGAFTRPQAEALGEAFHHAVALLRTATQADVSGLRVELKTGLSELFTEGKSGLAETRVWSVSVGATIIAVLAAIRYFG